MNKALIYFLLAVGIGLGVLFVGGALIGFAAGFVDGFWGASHSAALEEKQILGIGIMLLGVVLCAILNWVYLRNKYASYTLGPVPRESRVKALFWLCLAMVGMGVLSAWGYNPADEVDVYFKTMRQWMDTNPFLTILLIVIVEATVNLVIYGAVLREVFDWRPKGSDRPKLSPQLIILVYSLVMGVFSMVGNSPMAFFIGLTTAAIEASCYERCRSVVPLIIGDVVCWIVTMLVLDATLTEWHYAAAVVLVGSGVYMMLRSLDAYQPVEEG